MTHESPSGALCSYCVGGQGACVCQRDCGLRRDNRGVRNCLARTRESGRVLSCPGCSYQLVWRDGGPLPTVQHSEIPNEHALVRTEGATE